MVFDTRAPLTFIVALCFAGSAFANNMGLALQAYNKQDYSETIKLLKPLAESGNPEAQSLLGWMLYRGQGIRKSNKQALQWYVLAAEKGNSGAQFNLGFMYHQGHGVPLNYSEAVRWYIKAQEGGNIFAHYNLGLLVEEGKGIQQNMNLAFRLYLFAAKKRHPQSMGKIAYLYKEGLGVKRNYGLAYQWGFLATKREDALGVHVSNEIRESLTDSEIKRLEGTADRLL